nr:hypothetical protein [Tanacetum cinerariifolium]
MSRNRATFKTTILIHTIHRALHSSIFVVITAGFPVIHPPPQETSIEILHDHENVINSVQTFLRKFNRYSFFETPKVLLLAWDRVFEIKDALRTKKNKPEDLQELFRELYNDVQNIHEELAEYINTPGWNRPAFYDDDDDDDVDYTIAITPVLSTEEPVNSLSMGDEHLDTIPTTESDEVIKSCVENLVPNPSESEGENGCDVPSCFTTFSIILFDDEYEFNSVDDQSLHNVEFLKKIFSNPLFEEEIISIKKNQHHFNA